MKLICGGEMKLSRMTEVLPSTTDGGRKKKKKKKKKKMMSSTVSCDDLVLRSSPGVSPPPSRALQCPRGGIHPQLGNH